MAGRSPRQGARPAASGPPQRIRIIGGQWKRLLLQVPDLPGLRPTPDRVRETLFNWLGQELDGRHCLDMFAGTGALGFEAASRGAARVLMLEQSRQAAAALLASREKLGAARVEVMTGDALVFAAALPPASFDVIFLDPPFALDLLGPALAQAARVLKPDGRVYVECGQPVDLMLDAAAGGAASPWEILRQGRAGQSNHGLLALGRGAPG
ncbi:MAG: 16S rRNA (guanine(966)-N(2))-methyltransferase RsmD [Candidatus Protistobacter heckmanni]|nr:16S rRNA (guanine(966)-N(2))-methyltransferase RsmD [Candidatus Protistobacter heckmanni]